MPVVTRSTAPRDRRALRRASSEPYVPPIPVLRRCNAMCAPGEGPCEEPEEPEEPMEPSPTDQCYDFVRNFNTTLGGSAPGPMLMDAFCGKATYFHYLFPELLRDAAVFAHVLEELVLLMAHVDHCSVLLAQHEERRCARNYLELIQDNGEPNGSIRAQCLRKIAEGVPAPYTCTKNTDEADMAAGWTCQRIVDFYESSVRSAAGKFMYVTNALREKPEHFPMLRKDLIGAIGHYARLMGMLDSIEFDFPHSCPFGYPYSDDSDSDATQPFYAD